MSTPAARTVCDDGAVAAPRKTPLGRVIDRARVVVCMGAGGVGKTTVAAAMGVHAALAGRRVLVITIDPARRLQTALGLEDLDGGVRRIDATLFAGAGLWPRGQLDVEMLDSRAVLEAIVTRYAPDPVTRARVLASPLLRRVADVLAGVQTYMAMEKLHEVVRERDYDLVVLDTPPSATAVSFLEAPQRMVDLLDGPILASLPGIDTTRTAANRIVRRLAHFTGREVFESVGGLVSDLRGMFGGFGERARRVAGGLRANDCRFVVLTAPTALAVEEAIYFRKRLEEVRFPFAGFVVNGIQPSFGEPPDAAAVAGRLAAHGELSAVTAAALDGLSAALCRCAADAAALSRREHAVLEPLDAGSGFRVEVPRLARDIHDLRGLASLCPHLFGADPGVAADAFAALHAAD